jgi:hypothetical protein
MVGSAPWKKSSRSDGQNQCVEARSQAGQLQIRDSKLLDDSPIFELSSKDFAGFLASAKR